MNITIKSVPQERIRADQAGDWWIFGNDDMLVHTLETLSPEDQLRVAIHEVIEAWLCRGKVSEDSVCAFDYQYEAERKEGKHKEDDEPGDDPRSPYRKEHSAATHVERSVCHVLGIPYELKWPEPSQPELGTVEDHQKKEYPWIPRS